MRNLILLSAILFAIASCGKKIEKRDEADPTVQYWKGDYLTDPTVLKSIQAKAFVRIHFEKGVALFQFRANEAKDEVITWTGILEKDGENRANFVCRIARGSYSNHSESLSQLIPDSLYKCSKEPVSIRRVLDGTRVLLEVSNGNQKFQFRELDADLYRDLYESLPRAGQWRLWEGAKYFDEGKKAYLVEDPRNIQIPVPKLHRFYILPRISDTGETTETTYEQILNEKRRLNLYGTSQLREGRWLSLRSTSSKNEGDTQLIGYALPNNEGTLWQKTGKDGEVTFHFE